MLCLHTISVDPLKLKKINFVLALYSWHEWVLLLFLTFRLNFNTSRSMGGRGQHICGHGSAKFLPSSVTGSIILHAVSECIEMCWSDAESLSQKNSHGQQRRVFMANCEKPQDLETEADSASHKEESRPRVPVAMHAIIMDLHENVILLALYS